MNAALQISVPTRQFPIDEEASYGFLLPRLVGRHLRYGDDPTFYRIQALGSIQWLEKAGVALTEGTTVLDLGCGHGLFGAELVKKGCSVTFADKRNCLLPEVSSSSFHEIDIDGSDLCGLGKYQVVVCSNVLEHLSRPELFLDSIHQLLVPEGKVYLSWTNWFSPWGGHEFSPFHYLGARRGHHVYDQLVGGKRIHTPSKNLFPTTIGGVLKSIARNPALRILRRAPRYYTKLGFLIHIPLLREFLAWNCALLLGRKFQSETSSMGVSPDLAWLHPQFSRNT